jgi:hypothetical protein
MPLRLYENHRFVLASGCAPARRGHCQLLAEIAARRVADDMGAGAAEMIHQLNDIPDQPIKRELAVGRRHL